MVMTPSPARSAARGLQAPVSAAWLAGMVKIALPMTPLTMAAVRSYRPMTRTRPGGGGGAEGATTGAMSERDHDTGARGIMPTSSTR